MKQRGDIGPTRSTLWCAALLSLLYAALIAFWPALPTQDAPAWVFEGSLLQRVLTDHAVAGCSLVDALPPNAFAQVVIAGLSMLMSPEYAGRVYVASCVVVLIAAALYLQRSAPAAESGGTALLAVLPLCAGYPLYHGFLNYLAALPILCCALGALLRNPDARGGRGLALLLVAPVLLYTCHGTALAVWGLLIAVQCWVRRSRMLFARAAIGFMPVLVLLALYVLQRSTEGAALTWSAGSLGATVSYRLRSPLRFFSVFHGLAPTFDDPLLQAIAPVLVVLNVVYAVGLCAIGLTWAVRTRRSTDANQRFLALSLLALTLCFLVLPHDVAKMLNPAERLLLPAAFVGAAGCAGSSTRLRRPLYLLLGLQALYAAVWGTRAAKAAAELLQARAAVGFDAPVIQARQLRAAPPAPSMGAVGLLPRHQVLAEQGILEQFQRGHLVAPFDTGLFRCVFAQDDPSGWDLDRLRSPERPWNALILIGEREHTRAVADQLRPSFGTLKVGTGFYVLQRIAANP